MTKNIAKPLSALLVLTAFSVRASAAVPTCSEWSRGDRQAESCTCGSETREGDARQAPCVEGGAPNPTGAGYPGFAATIEAPARRIAGFLDPNAGFDGRKFGVRSVTLGGGYVTGADGSGTQNGVVGVEFYRQKTKAGTLSGSVEIGRERMGGIPFSNVQDAGVVAQLPDGTPVEGTVYTQGASPAVTYVPLANFKYAPPLKLGRLHPFAVGEAGVTTLSSVNAKAYSTLVATVDGQVVGTQNLGLSYQPTGEARNHPGGGFGGGASVDLTRRVALNTQFIDAPTGYKALTYGVTYDLRRPKKKDDTKK